jgi:hypothetical protein
MEDQLANCDSWETDDELFMSHAISIGSLNSDSLKHTFISVKLNDDDEVSVALSTIKIKHKL